MIRLFFVDDHPIITSGLAARYQSTEGFCVIGTANTIKALDDHIHEVDVALVDFQLEATLSPRQVGRLAQQVRVVVFSARSDEPVVQQLLAAGAAAVVNKATPLPTLDAILRDVHTGQWRSPSASTTPPSLKTLSARELEVYRALAHCQTPKEVAATLGIARSTVYCHIDGLRQKLGVETLQEIVAHAYSALGD